MTYVNNKKQQNNKKETKKEKRKNNPPKNNNNKTTPQLATNKQIYILGIMFQNRKLWPEPT